MTDKELLELAAKAAGYNCRWCEPRGVFERLGDVLAVLLQDEWNPLTDEGDALRLAVRLKITVVYATDKVFASPSESLFSEFELLDADPYSATRRAITRAAAAIGEAK